MIQLMRNNSVIIPRLCTISFPWDMCQFSCLLPFEVEEACWIVVLIEEQHTSIITVISAFKYHERLGVLSCWHVWMPRKYENFQVVNNDWLHDPGLYLSWMMAIEESRGPQSKPGEEDNNTNPWLLLHCHLFLFLFYHEETCKEGYPVVL